MPGRFRSGAPLALGLCLLLAAPLPGQSPRHPLDPLSPDEYRAVVAVLQGAGKADSATRYSLVTLEEPPKAAVLAWRPEQPVPRAAFAVVREGGRAFEAVVDLGQRRLASWRPVPGVQPTFLAEELTEAGDIALHAAVFRAALARRGVSPDDLTCIGLPPGTPESALEAGRRVARVFCTVTRGSATFPWGRVVGGLNALVDLDAKRVLRVEEDPAAAAPVPAEGARYDSAAVGATRPPLPPLAVRSPDGPGFRVDGAEVTWDRWSFHARVDPRVGLVIGLAAWNDRGRRRPVLYEGSLSEAFVPYMDPSRPWFGFTFMDAGEYSGGGFAKPLAAGVDCPEGAAYLDAVLAGSDGQPLTIPRSACIFERPTEDPAWRHLDFLSQTTEARPRRELVVRMCALLGNYDYLFDWSFQQDGSIQVRVGLTGVTNVKPVAAATAAGDVAAAGAAGDPPAKAAPAGLPADAYGRFVAPHLVAPNHDHFFNFRLDLDVDGPGNSLVLDRLVTRRLPAGSPRQSLWVTDGRVAHGELEARQKIDMEHPAAWIVVNPTHRNAVGYATGYQLVPGMNAVSLLAPDEYAQRRAGFVDYQLWATPYRPNERYAAGLYPTLSRPGQGLAAWTRADRRIDDRDIVLWYTLGMHHVPRAEDWPVMPVTWIGFDLRPFDFFDRNPALDLPR